MATKQYITRKGNFDSAHRVMNERMKCFSTHGHTYVYEITFEFDSASDIGYNIDFKEIKRVGCQWIDDILDHGAILNPHDTILINAVRALNNKLWLMSLNGEGEYCNPSVENIAKEVFLALEILFDGRKDLRVHQVRIFETPNCSTNCFVESVTESERANFYESRHDEIASYRNDKGVMEYDDRKLD